MQQQQKLDLAWGVVNGPKSVETNIVKSCKTVKEAVILSWNMRRIKRMTQSHCAALCGFHAPHFSQWLNPDESKPDIPAKHIASFESIVGNTLVTQYLGMKAGLTIMEEVQANIQAERSAA